ncbi:unnamed protein product [Ixodes hexagonus]
MEARKQTPLTRFYSARKLGSDALIKGLVTPKSGKKIAIGVSSGSVVSQPSKRRRLDSWSLNKTPTSSGEHRRSTSQLDQCPVRRQLRLQDELKGPTNSSAIASRAEKQDNHGGTELTALQESRNVMNLIDPDALKKLTNSSRLEEVQARLKAIGQARAGLSAAKLKSSAKRAGVETIEEEQPAYERYHRLAEDCTPSLTLPFSYKQLAEQFRCCDTIVSMMFNRKEVCTFDKLKPSVEVMSKKRFGKEVLGQIKTVYPDSYLLTQEKLSQPGVTNKTFQLVITPQFSAGLNTGDDPGTMSAACLLQRRKHFHSLLLSQVKQCHSEFLATLDPPVSIPPEDIVRWHPRFPLDSITVIQAAPLPESPLKEKCSSAQDVLNRVKGKLNKRIENALESLVQKQCGVTAATPIPSIDKGARECLKGVSQDLLARIRERESFKLVREMTLRPEHEKERTELSNLPEFIRITRSLFLAEQKAAVARDDLVRKVKESFSSVLAVGEVEALVQLASRVLPDWFKVLSIKRGVFVKIVKEKDVNELVARVTSKLQE